MAAALAPCESVTGRTRHVAGHGVTAVARGKPDHGGATGGHQGPAGGTRSPGSQRGTPHSAIAPLSVAGVSPHSSSPAFRQPSPAAAPTATAPDPPALGDGGRTDGAEAAADRRQPALCRRPASVGHRGRHQTTPTRSRGEEETQFSYRAKGSIIALLWALPRLMSSVWPLKSAA